MKAIMNIDKVHPVIIAVILAILVVTFLPTGVLSELRGEKAQFDVVTEVEPRADAVLSLLFLTATEDGRIIHNNSIMWSTASLARQELPLSLLQNASLP